MASISAAARFALAVAVGCACILSPILDGVSPRSAVLDAAVAIALITLPITFFLGVILVFVHVTPEPLVSPGASRRLAVLAYAVASALLAALAVPLVAFVFLGAGCSPPGFGQ
ncbi:unnamed protein product [Urochloa humidicola]